MPFKNPPFWSDSDLKLSRDRAERLFVDYRKEEGPRAFERMYLELRPKVETLLVLSDDLRSFTGEVFRQDPDSWQVARYLTAPPISQEDLWTLVGGPKFRRVPPSIADETADALRVVLDPVRFPWLSVGRSPTETERESAVIATTVLWAAQQVGTARRGEASIRQEQATGEALGLAGLSFDPSRGRVEFVDDMARGTYSRERIVANSKCDVPARLADGRLFTLECKVSNGPKNGWKRVNREVVGKATDWRNQFGGNLVAAVVLSGVFDLAALRSARDHGVTIFWEHDLEPLTEFANMGG